MEIERAQLLTISRSSQKKQRESPENGDWKTTASSVAMTAMMETKGVSWKWRLKAPWALWTSQGAHWKQRESPENGDWKTLIFLKIPCRSKNEKQRESPENGDWKAGHLERETTKAQRLWNKGSLLKMEIESCPYLHVRPVLSPRNKGSLLKMEIERGTDYSYEEHR